jgi:hypothetical protein
MSILTWPERELDSPILDDQVPVGRGDEDHAGLKLFAVGRRSAGKATSALEDRGQRARAPRRDVQHDANRGIEVRWQVADHLPEHFESAGRSAYDDQVRALGRLVSWLL